VDAKPVLAVGRNLETEDMNVNATAVAMPSGVRLGTAR